MIEACPPHKPAIPVPELLKRLALLQPCDPGASVRGRAVALTIAEPTYLDKARARPGSRFIAGADAIARMLEPNWGYDVGYMLEEMDRLNTLFYVIGRRIHGEFVTIEDLRIPPAFRHLFRHLEGCCDTSSTATRNKVAIAQI